MHKNQRNLLNNSTAQALAAQIEAVLTGRRGKHFSKTAIHEYAKNIAPEVVSLVPLAYHARDSYKQWINLGEAIEGAIPAIDALRTALAANYEIEISHSTAVNSTFIDHDCDPCFRVNLGAVREYLVTLKHLHSAHKQPAPRGKNNRAALVLAETLAIHYHRFFKTMPSCGRSRVIESKKRGAILKKTPFDKVCEVVENTCGIKIPESTRRSAIKAITHGGITDS